MTGQKVRKGVYLTILPELFLFHLLSPAKNCHLELVLVLCFCK